MREFLEQRITQQDKMLAAILEQTTLTNGRLRVAERDIAVLKDRANPWTAGGVGAGLMAAAAAAFEYLKR